MEKNLIANMITIAVIIIGLMVLFSIINFDLTPIQDKYVEKIVDIESFSMMDKGFCKSHKGNSKDLQISCSELTKKNCLATSCCVYAKMDGKEQCHAGDESGPTFRRDSNGKTKDIDYYYFKNKCYGNGCSTNS